MVLIEMNVLPYSLEEFSTKLCDFSSKICIENRIFEMIKS